MRIVVASTLAVLATAAAIDAASSQMSEGLTDCGGRPPMRYAAVFDASSSVRGNPELRADTEASYRKLLGLLGGLLCTGDRLAVYTFASDSSTRMDPLVEITSASRTPSLLSATARRVIDARSSHTDLHLVTRGIVRDVIPGAPDAIFVVTDGSYYPFRPTPHDRTLAGVRNRLTELASFVNDSVRPESSRVFVIGVNAANSYAVDRQLGAVLPAASSQRRWKDLDLLDDHGEDLLQEVFGTRYIGSSQLSLWDVLVGLPQSVWAQRLGYLTDQDLPWSEVSTLSVQHLVYVPGGPGGSSSCIPPSADGVPARVEEAGYAVDGGILCSLSHPTPAQMAAIHRASRFYAFRQGTSLWPATGTGPIRGLNDVLLRDSANECSTGSVRSYFGGGDQWPPQNARRVGELRISPVDSIRWSEPIGLIRLGAAGCVVPRFTRGEWPSPPGEYFVKVAHRKTSVFRVTVKPPRSQVVEAYIRPGGLPFPSDRIALVRVCVRTRPALAGHERLWMHLGDKFLLLTLERGHRCAGAAADVAAFSGLVGLEHTDRGSAEVFVADESDDPDRPQDGEWVAVTLKRDGKLFLSWLHLSLWFVGGMLVQIGYVCVPNRRFRVERLGRVATWSGAVISGIIVAVVAEFAVLVMETDVDSDRIPVIFALSVLAHMAKLLAAALVPEHVEEFLLTD